MGGEERWRRRPRAAAKKRRREGVEEGTGEASIAHVVATPEAGGWEEGKRSKLGNHRIEGTTSKSDR